MKTVIGHHRSSAPRGCETCPPEVGTASACIRAAAVRTRELQVACQLLPESGFCPYARCLSFLDLKTGRGRREPQLSSASLPGRLFLLSYRSPQIVPFSSTDSPSLMTSSQRRLHNRCRGLCYTGSRASAAGYRRAAPRCCGQHETGRRGAERGARGHAARRGRPRALPPPSPSPAEPGWGGQRTPALTGGEDPLLEAAARGPCSALSAEDAASPAHCFPDC